MNAIDGRGAAVIPALVLMVLMVLLVGPGGAAAASPGPAPREVPTVGQLLAACARGAANGNQGLDAATCEWFAAPCGCKPGQIGSTVYRWCIPATEPTETTVGKVVAALRRVPDRAAPIDQVLPVILARLYPCRAGGDD